MLDRNNSRRRFSESDSAWARSFALESIKCLIVCRGPVRKEAADVFDAIGMTDYGMLLSEKDFSASWVSHTGRGCPHHHCL